MTAPRCIGESLTIEFRQNGERVYTRGQRTGKTSSTIVHQGYHTMERFVQAIVGGGLALIAGLWLVRLSPSGSVAWGLGILLVVLGLGGLCWGIVSELE